MHDGALSRSGGFASFSGRISSSCGQAADGILCPSRLRCTLLPPKPLWPLAPSWVVTPLSLGRRQYSQQPWHAAQARPRQRALAPAVQRWQPAGPSQPALHPAQYPQPSQVQQMFGAAVQYAAEPVTAPAPLPYLPGYGGRWRRPPPPLQPHAPSNHPYVAPQEPAISATLAPPGAADGMLEGCVQRITWRAPDTGYTVLRVEVSGRNPADATLLKPEAPQKAKKGRKKKDVLTVVGIFPNVTVGQALRFEGTWQHHKSYGEQLNASHYEELQHDSEESLERYLAGGTVPGVGPKTAKALVEQFGNTVLEMLDKRDAVTRLQLCTGVGPTLAKKIKQGWDGNRGRREGEAFLQQNGLPQALVRRVLTRFGTETVTAVKQDPYHVLKQSGIFNFKAADLLAAKLGMSAEMPSRGAAAMLTVLAAAAAKKGHTYLTWGQLSSDAMRLLHSTGRPWGGTGALLRVAQSMCAAGDLVAESAGQQPLHLSTWRAATQAATAQALLLPSGSLPAPGNKLKPSASQAIRDKLVAGIAGVGPAKAQLIVHTLGSHTINVLNMPEDKAIKRLCDVPSIGPVTAQRFKRSWDRRQVAGSSNAVQAASQPAPLPDVIWDAHTRCYKPDMFAAEASIAQRLAALVTKGPAHIENGTARLHTWLRKNEKQTGMVLSAGQREAVVQASTAPLLLLTGGPGCGKTTATRTIVKLWRAMSKRVAICAPTGRAAQRLAAAANYKSTTIHRMLGVRGRAEVQVLDADGQAAEADGEVLDGDYTSFQHNANNPLQADAVLVDETSMLDVRLAAALLDALPTDRPCQLVLVGDADQLPPVGPGAVLAAAVASRVIPTVDLREIFRQAQESAIVLSAHSVNSGHVPALFTLPPDLLQGGASADEVRRAVGRDDAVWVQVEEGDPQWTEDAAVAAIAHLLPALGVDVLSDLQVMSPMRKGAAGTGSLNARLQALLNPPHPAKRELHRRTAGAMHATASLDFRTGDRVIQLLNDPEKEIYNGDLGVVQQVVGDTELLVDFPHPSDQDKVRSHTFKGRELEQLDLAWATTVHKAQGGESKVVVLLLSHTHYPLLTRRLLYTALTRAKELLVVVGPQRALQTAVRQVSDDKRQCSLQDRLQLSGLPRQQPSSFGYAPLLPAAAAKRLPANVTAPELSYAAPVQELQQAA